MVDHGAARDLAAIALDFELTDEEQVQLDQHLAACADCRAFADGLRVDARALVDLPRLDAPARVERAVKAARGTWIVRPSVLAAAVGTIALVIVVVVGSGTFRFGFGSAGATASEPPVAAASEAPGSIAPPASVAASEAPQASTGPPQLAWIQAPDQPALGAVGVPDEDVSTSTPPPGDTAGGAPATTTEMLASVATADGLVAVGHSCRFGRGSLRETCRAAVWLSADGLAWEPAPAQPSLEAGADAFSDMLSGMADVTSGGPGLVAGGWLSDAAGTTAAIWTSRDGRTWDRATVDGAAGGRIRAMLRTDEGIAAVGEIIGEDAIQAAVWSSTDAATWDLTLIDDLAIGPDDDRAHPDVGMRDVVATDEGLVAVGNDCPDGCRPVAWLAETAAGPWERQAIDDPVHVVEAIAATGETLVAVGRDEESLGAIWTSGGTGWKRIDLADVFAEGEGLFAVAASETSTLAAGDVALESADARSWTSVDVPGLEGSARILGISPFGAGLVAVGSVATGEEEPVTPAAWVLAPAPE